MPNIGVATNRQQVNVEPVGIAINQRDIFKSTVMQYKRCSKCGSIKPITGFYTCSAKKAGVKSECKECSNKRELNYKHTKIGLIKDIYKQQKTNSKKRRHDKPAYDINTLIDFVINNQKFDVLYLGWVKSGYNKLLRPSLDRLDNTKGYSLDNIRIVTWDENNKAAIKDVRDGKLINTGCFNGGCKPVIAINIKTGKRIKYHSLAEAERQTGAHEGNIWKCCVGKRNSASGYKFEYDK